jgi:hypothetical protein
VKQDVECAPRDRPEADSARLAGRVEQLDDQDRKAREIVKHFNERLAGDDTRLGQAYLQFKSKIAFRRIGRTRRNYGIVLEALPDWSKFDSGKRHYDCARGIDDGKKVPMFPRRVEFVQSDETIIPSFVRLEIFDSSLIGSGKPLYFFSSRVKQVVEGIGIIPDREISVGWTTMAVALSESDSEQIKTASNGMDYNASLGCDNSWNRLHIIESNDLLSGLRIQICSETERIGVSPSNDFFFQNWEVGYGPVNCGPCI